MDKKKMFLLLTVFLLVFVTVIVYSQSDSNIRWEYNVFTTQDASEIVSRSNRLGSHGWELVSTTLKDWNGQTTYTLFFKRRTP